MVIFDDSRRAHFQITRANIGKAIRPAILSVWIAWVTALSILNASAADVTNTPAFQAPWPAGLQLTNALSHSWHSGTESQAVDYKSIDNPNGLIPVLAAADGIVVYASSSDCVNDTSYGCQVVLGHANGFQSRYASLNQMPIVEQGQQVTQGAILGFIGATGREKEQPILHFNIYQCTATIPEGEICPAQNLTQYMPEDLNQPTVTSNNFSVGYEVFQSNDEALQAFLHEPILDAYWLARGQNGLVGLPAGTVQQYSDTRIYFQEFLPPANNGEGYWTSVSSTIIEVEEQGYHILGPVWKAYLTDRGGPGGDLGLPIDSTISGTLNGEPAYRTNFQGKALFWLGPGQFRDMDKALADEAFTPDTITLPQVEYARYLPPPFPGETYPATRTPTPTVTPTLSSTQKALLSVTPTPSPTATHIPVGIALYTALTTDSSLGIILFIITILILITVVSLIILFRKIFKASRRKYFARIIVDGKAYALRPSGNLIGGDASCNFHFIDPEISPFHARILYRKGYWWLCDLNSQTGTYLNKKRLVSARFFRLFNEDQIIIGATTITIRLSVRQ